MMKRASDKALSPHAISWDNYQSKKSVHAEQSYSVSSKVKLGTSIIRYPNPWVLPGVCSLQKILERRGKGELISFAKHVKPTMPHNMRINEHLELDIIQILLGSHSKFRPYLNSNKLQHKRRHWTLLMIESKLSLTSKPTNPVN